MQDGPRLFDLNIEKILEAWNCAHAVRELIANAFDEQILTNTREAEIEKSKGTWTIRDYGRGLRYAHFTQNENPEKLKAVGRVIGKFGVGLKDALATLDRKGIKVEIESAHAVITLVQRPKHGFASIRTLHAAISPAGDPKFVGTIVRLQGLPDDEMKSAKGFFLKFTGDTVLEETHVGQVLKKKGSAGRIYVAGLLVAEEPNFAFSYNITSLTEAMKKALNRERTNVGRTAYSERIKAMLLQSKSEAVARVLAEQLTKIELGTASDEVKNWKDVAVHACKILNAGAKTVFVTASQLTFQASTIDQAKADGYEIVVLPEWIYGELDGLRDLTGAQVRDLGVFQQQWNASFKFKWVPRDKLTARERDVFDSTKRIAALVQGLPSHVKDVRISHTMRMDFGTGRNALGLWDPETSSIVIKRDQLRSVRQYSGTLLHEIAHARSEFPDVSSGFEDELTEYLGMVSAAALTRTPSTKRSRK